ncbi:ABC transporter permease [Actinopolymorpha alba]|uniref:ABC transporter permease n=1 Tax=Actinopolymorpha alba TaxID=533267 RepID=UPI0004756FAF|nr:ABC transporter permease [Actinopolymorpha alba]
MALARYALSRLALMAATIAVLVPLTFLLFRAVPGDPSAAVIGPNLDPAVQGVLRERYGVDEPLAIQLVKYLGRLAHGDLGMSFQYKRPVSEILAGKLFNTGVLVVPAIVLALLLGTAIGALTAASRRSLLDRVVRNAAFTVKASPIFWTASLAVLLFSLRLDWLPSVGMRTPGQGDAGSGLAAIWSTDFLWHLALPLAIMTLFFMPEPLLTMRTAMKENLHEDFIELAQAQGLRRRRVIYWHAARNALLPVVTLMPALTGVLIGGQVIVETVFSWPGMGREIVNAVNTYDYPMMQGVFLLTGLLAVTVNTVVDILYAYLDPRVRLT